MPIKIIECPRDAMQGWAHQIATETKINYINNLLKIGFDTIDCGSFVSPKAIPQMADTAKVLEEINLENSKSKLLVIVANERGAQEAVLQSKITYIGYPFSISETFQKLNTNSTIEESLHRVEAIQKLCVAHQKQLVLYISMGFGNPYGDEYNAALVIKWVSVLKEFGIKIFSLSDTVGLAQAQDISYIEFGAHLHTTADTWQEKIDAAVQAGCKRFDGAIGGIGGCPMAQNELVGNMDTINLVNYFKDLDINKSEFEKCVLQKNEVFI
jgi:hydroxymethylglutaryl-CoA lyase